MRLELDNLLCSVAPTLYQQRNQSMSVTCMCWGFPGDGWFGLLLEASIALEALGQGIVALQVKEKFGTLRLYTNVVNDESDAIIRRAEERSARECEECGAAGIPRDGGWVQTLCDAHAPVGQCGICKVIMSGKTPETVNCGGDCAKCMADSGDPDDGWGRATDLMRDTHVEGMEG